MNTIQSSIQCGYSMEVSDSDGKDFLWGVVDYRVVEDLK